MELPRSDHISRTTEVRKRYDFNHIWSHSTRMFVRFIRRQWIVDLIWRMLCNSLHRRAMSKDCRFVTGIIACRKSQMVRFVIIIIDYDGLNMYLTIQVIPQPTPCRLEDIFTDLRFAKRTPNARFVDLLKTANSRFPSSMNVHLKSTKRPINVLNIYSVWKKLVCFSDDLFSLGFHLWIS